MARDSMRAGSPSWSTRSRELRLLVLGDVVLDEYLWGDVERVSPEAPVPVVHVQRESMVLGGAGNVVRNVIALGAACDFCTAVGDDRAGERVLELLAELGVDARGTVRVAERPTTRKTRVVARSQQIVRFDRETDEAAARERCARAARRDRPLRAARARRDRRGLRQGHARRRVPCAPRCASSQAHGVPVAVDPKEDLSPYRGASLVKPNLREAEALAGMRIHSTARPRQGGAAAAPQARRRRGGGDAGRRGHGALRGRRQRARFVGTPRREVFDVQGAGDTTIAALSLALRAGGSLLEAAVIANAAAGVVVTQGRHRDGDSGRSAGSAARGDRGRERGAAVIRSMTGYGHATFEVEGIGFEVEVRSVNHRHLDVRVRLPHGLAVFEAEVRQQVAGQLDRGKVDLAIRGVSGDTPSESVALDLAAAEQYLRAARQLRDDHGVPGELDVRGLLGLPGVARVVERALPEERVRSALAGGVAAALGGLASMRAAEGEALDRELRGRLDRIDALVVSIAARATDVQRAVRERCASAPSSCATRPGCSTRRACIRKWCGRRIVSTSPRRPCASRATPRSSAASSTPPAPETPAGRRLEFLLQEMGREGNTIGSKGSDAPIAHQVVELKTELERLREQVLNVE